MKDSEKTPEAAPAAPEPAAQPQEAAPAQPAVPPLPPFKGLLGRKVGMTRIFSEYGQAMGVTVIEAGPCPVVQVKTPAHDGYSAITLGFGEPSKQQTNKARSGVFAKVGLPETRTLKEFRIPSAEGFQAGQSVDAACFSKGDYVDVSGISKGKGFAGAVKRHRFAGGPRTHGQSDRLRAPGANSSQGGQRVKKGQRRPGHMGAAASTVQCVEVVHVDAGKRLLAVLGSIPGPNGNLVRIEPTVKRIKARVGPPPGAVKAAKAEKGKAAKAPAKK